MLKYKLRKIGSNAYYNGTTDQSIIAYAFINRNRRKPSNAQTCGLWTDVLRE